MQSGKPKCEGYKLRGSNKGILQLRQADPSSLGVPHGGEEIATGVRRDVLTKRLYCDRRNQHSGKPKCEGSEFIPVITIDGPTSSGKGTVGRLLSYFLGWHFLDSGAIYRVLAFKALEQNISPQDHAALINLANNLHVTFVTNHDQPIKIILSNESTQDSQNGLKDKDVVVTDLIRQERCGLYASQIATIPQVRKALLKYMLSFRRPPGLVADGRDMGTVVFPDAILKIFLTASPRIRAYRRWQQLQKIDLSVSLQEVENDLNQRDQRDAERKDSPLQPAPDALVIDASELSIDEVMQLLIKNISLANRFSGLVEIDPSSLGITRGGEE